MGREEKVSSNLKNHLPAEPSPLTPPPIDICILGDHLELLGFNFVEGRRMWGGGYKLEMPLGVAMH